MRQAIRVGTHRREDMLTALPSGVQPMAPIHLPDDNQADGAGLLDRHTGGYVTGIRHYPGVTDHAPHPVHLPLSRA